MLKAKQAKEIVVRLENGSDPLAKFSRIVAERGINALALCTWVEDGRCVVRLLTDDTLRTADLLREHAYDFKTLDVVTVNAPHKPGILQRIAQTLAAENVGVSHLFATAGLDQAECLVVLNTSDNARAIVLLNR
jgi:hypothetical protein